MFLPPQQTHTHTHLNNICCSQCLFFCTFHMSNKAGSLGFSCSDCVSERLLCCFLSLFLSSWLTSLPPPLKPGLHAVSVVCWCRCANLLTPPPRLLPGRNLQHGWLPGRKRPPHNPPEKWGHSSGRIHSIRRTWSHTRWMAAGVRGKYTPSAPSSRETGENWPAAPTLLLFSLFLLVSVLK